MYTAPNVAPAPNTIPYRRPTSSPPCSLAPPH
jgi:hypothetical protein